MVWHPLLPDTVFVANELDNSISLCHWDSAAMLLTVACSQPLLPLSCKEQVLSTTPAASATQYFANEPVTLFFC
jgi:hypothetical protein